MLFYLVFLFDAIFIFLFLLAQNHANQKLWQLYLVSITTPIGDNAFW